MKILMLFILVFISSCSHSEQFPVSDHYDGSRFFNPNGPGTKSLWDVFLWKLKSNPADWPSEVKNKKYVFKKIDSEKAVITFINHATFMIQLPELNILTDPIFVKRAGPFQSFGPVKRVREAGIDLKNLPKIDLILISHNHYDHLSLEDLKTIALRDRPVILCPLGDKKLLENNGLKNIKELDWWTNTNVKNVLFTFTPVQHWSARGVFDKNKSLWGGYFIQKENLKMYFAGDTGYTRYFKLTKERLGAPDISLLPIGAFEPRWFMKDFHMDPEEALKAHLDLSSKLSFGMHFGTFKLTDEAYTAPVDELKEKMKKLNLTEKSFKVLDFGESYFLH
jgi:L-ascorbate metabolism protein UlaG (beta-lactamase superfamily)